MKYFYSENIVYIYGHLCTPYGGFDKFTTLRYKYVSQSIVFCLSFILYKVKDTIIVKELKLLLASINGINLSQMTIHNICFSSSMVLITNNSA